MVVMLVGIAFFSILTAAIASTSVKQDEKPDEVRADLQEGGERLESRAGARGAQARQGGRLR